MKILVSAFACRPNSGSETGVGWRWALELAKRHDVLVITDESRRIEIERELRARPINNLGFVFYRPSWLKWMPLRSATAQFLFSAWQYCLLPTARDLHRKHKFDLIIHLTYGVFRHPSFLGFVGPPFVFGPVGGGEDAPWRLKRSLPLREQAREVMRATMNCVARLNPFLKVAISQATVIFAKTADTARVIPKSVNGVIPIVHQEIGIERTFIAENHGKRRDPRQPLRALFVGRLLGLKGLHLAIRSIAMARENNCRVTLTIVGTGPIERQLKSFAERFAVADEITWLGQIAQRDLIPLYREFDCFLFPSLHDSSGNAVLEAMASGLPVVCLDRGGPPLLVSQECATIVPTLTGSEREVAGRITAALEELATDEAKRLQMSRSAIARARVMTWEGCVESAMGIVEREVRRLRDCAHYRKS